MDSKHTSCFNAHPNPKPKPKPNSEHILNEKMIMFSCTHPFILEMVGAFQDSMHLYILLELAHGGELFTLLRRKGTFAEPMARFYSACVVSAFTTLHERSVAYRDLKLENLLLDAKGYVKMCDFGFAKVVEDRTWTLCGTPEYMAPEIICNVGHSMPVDWWALGILVYEFIVGRTPFNADDPMSLYRLILKGNVTYPPHISKKAKALIMNLLTSKPATRLGTLNQKDVVNHTFFKVVDFGQLLKRKVKPPWAPKVKNEKDISAFGDVDPDNGLGHFHRPSWDMPVNEVEQINFEGFS